MLIYLAIDRLLKDAFQRPRPPLSCKKSYGFPSSHAAVIWAFVWFWTRQGGIARGVLAAALAAGVCYSRVVLNYHSVDQVLVGGVLGFFGAAGFSKALEAGLAWVMPTAKDE
jgi:membrane-associated phospholipid phosphatase